MTNQLLTPKQQTLLTQAQRQAPLTIYQLAKAANRPYRRVYDHVQKLAALGLVQLEATRVNNRQATLVIPTDPYYQRLMRLDDMYAAYLEFGVAP